MSTGATTFKRGWHAVLSSALIALVAVIAVAPVPGVQAALDVPQGILYQGRLTDSNRITVDDGAYDMYFYIWDGSDETTNNVCSTNDLYVSGGTCGTPVATSVTVTDGVFSVMLGVDTAGFSDDLFDDDSSTDFWLEVWIEGEQLLPRRQIGATAFALQAGDSHLLDDKAASATGCTGECIPATDGNGNLLITGDPTGAGIGDGSLYINPASPGAGETIFGVANNGTQLFVVDAAGDGALAGGLELSDTLSVDGNTFTTDSVIDIYQLDSLTTGTGITVASNSADTSTRLLVDIINSNSLATGTATLGLQQESLAAPYIQMTDTTDTFGFYSWQGDPETNITANIGSLAIDTTAGALYVKTSDADANNWSEISGGGGTTLYSGNGTLSGARSVTLDGNALTFAGNTDDVVIDDGDITVGGNDLTFGNLEAISNNTDGTLDVNANFIPNNDDTYDLGTSAVRWRDLYLGPASLHVGVDGNDGSLGFNTVTSKFEFDTDILAKGPIVVTGEPTADTPAGAALSVNPASPGVNEYIFSAANNGANVFRVDAEGDVVIDGTLQMNGDWSNNGVTTLGDASDDNINLNGSINTSIALSADNSYALGTDDNRLQKLYVNSSEGIHIGDTGGEAATSEATIGLSGGDLSFTSDDGFVFNVDDDNLGEDVVTIDDDTGPMMVVTRDGTNGSTALYRGLETNLTNDGAFTDDTSGTHTVVTRNNPVGNIGDTTNNAPVVRGEYIEVITSHVVDGGGTWIDNKGIDISLQETSSNAGVGVDDPKQEKHTGLNIAVNSDSTRGHVYGITIDVDSDISGVGSNNEEFESAIAITRGGFWMESDDDVTLDQSSSVTDMGNTGTMFVGGDVEINSGGLCVGNSLTGTACSGALTDGTIYADIAAVSGFDLAEVYPATSAILPGEIVTVSADGDEYVEPAEANQIIIGAISTDPGLVLGQETVEDGYYPVALTGRVPVKVNNENGAISIGDRIAVSSTTGIGMKATEASEVVGVAMQPASFTSTTTDAIVVFVQPHKWDGEDLFDMSVTEDEPEPVINTNAAFAFEGGNITGISSLSGNEWSVDSEGIFVTEGSYGVAVKSNQNELVDTYAVLGMEHYITLAGTADISGGAARVLFEEIDPDFNNIIDGSAPIFVTATPSNGSGSVFIQDKDSSGFRIFRDGDGTASEVDWMVMAYRTNYGPAEDEEVEEDTEDEGEVVEVSEEEDPAESDAPEEEAEEEGDDEVVEEEATEEEEALEEGSEELVEEPSDEPVEELVDEEVIEEPPIEEVEESPEEAVEEEEEAIEEIAPPIEEEVVSEESDV